jgi:uncharacterized RDD family membrane protein YckC
MSDLAHHHVQYAGFLRRAMAFWLDMLLISLISSGIMMFFQGGQYLQKIQSLASLDWQIIVIENIIPALWTIGFWFIWMATPAKLLLDCQVVDARTTQKAGLLQLIIRYLGYILSILPLGLGFLWILIDKRNQGWHDKLANTVVVMQDESRINMSAYTS